MFQELVNKRGSKNQLEGLAESHNFHIDSFAHNELKK